MSAVTIISASAEDQRTKAPEQAVKIADPIQTV
jgi:hypothetical protein